MSSFYNTWRKRLACERCRQLKVRCEYKGPTSDICIRCEKSHTQCVIPSSKKHENGHANGSSSPEQNEETVQVSKQQNAVYFQNLIREAEEKLIELNVSPLRQALAAELYTVEEVESYYADFRKNFCMFPIITNLNLPDSLMEVDKAWPWIAIALVTVKAVNSTGKSLNDVQLYVQSLYRNEVESRDASVVVDRTLAFAILCQFALVFRSNNVNALLSLHGKTDLALHCLRQTNNHKLSKSVLHMAVITILPYTFDSQFAAINPLITYYHSKITGQDTRGVLNLDPQGQCECLEASASDDGLAAVPMMEMTLAYHRAMSALDAALSFEEIGQVFKACVLSYREMVQEIVEAYNSFARHHGVEIAMVSNLPISENVRIMPFLSTYAAAHINILHRAIVRCLVLSNSDQCAGYPLVKGIVAQCADVCGQLFRAFGNVDSNESVFPNSMLYHVSRAVSHLQTMRFAAFAASCDIDVRSDCLLNIVVTKWEDLMRNNMLIRTHLNLIFKILDLSVVKIGQYDQTTNSVAGSGSMSQFEVICFDGASHKVREIIPIRRSELVELLIFVASKNLDGYLPSFEKVNQISLATALKLLLHDV